MGTIATAVAEDMEQKHKFEKMKADIELQKEQEKLLKEHELKKLELAKEHEKEHIRLEKEK